jgi:hypothetical protein
VDEAGDARVTGCASQDRRSMDRDPLLRFAIAVHRVDGCDDAARTVHHCLRLGS